MKKKLTMYRSSRQRQQQILEDKATERWNDDHASMLEEQASQQRKSKKVVYIAIAAAIMFVLFMVYGIYMLFWSKSANATITTTTHQAVPPSAIANNKFIDDPVFALPSYVYRNR